MSWRVAICPCTIEGEVVTPQDDRGADWVIPEGADDTAVDAVAHACAWSLPLRIFAPSREDGRLLRLLRTLESRGHEYALGDVYVRPAPGRHG